LPWKVEILPEMEKTLAGPGHEAHKRILKFMKRVAALKDPRSIGEPLKGSRLGGLWRYRVGDYRVLCDIQDSQIVIIVIIVVFVGHRREVYK
jgi:mRNA interferase RelE/StbE